MLKRSFKESLIKQAVGMFINVNWQISNCVHTWVVQTPSGYPLGCCLLFHQDDATEYSCSTLFAYTVLVLFEIFFPSKLCDATPLA